MNSQQMTRHHNPNHRGVYRRRPKIKNDNNNNHNRRRNKLCHDARSSFPGSHAKQQTQRRRAFK